MRQLVTFLSDFGLSDTYVSEVKGALYGAHDDVKVVDITHLIPPYQVLWGAFQLFRSYRAFPKGTVHLGAVDPSVGSARKLLYVKTKDYYFVGPDNGLLLWAIRDCEMWDKKEAEIFEIPAPPTRISNFETRDILAPFIVNLLNNKVPSLKKVNQLNGKQFPGAREIEGRCRGEILGSDQFGNVITSIPIGKVTKADLQIEHREERILSVEAYADIPPNKVALIPGSHGFWELSAREKPAWDLLSLEQGMEVTLHPLD